MIRHQYGVTLIELMIAMVIFGLLFAMGIPSYRGWIQNSQVRTAAESVLNGLQLARAEAVRMNERVSFTLNANGKDWSVDVVADPTYNIPASNVQRRSGREGSPNAVIASNQSLVVFNQMGRMTPLPAANVVFSVTNPTAGACAAVNSASGVRCMNVLVQGGGHIRMCDPALQQINNPQGC